MPSTHVMQFQSEELRQIKSIAGSEADCAVLMLNQNRYHPAAGFPHGEEYQAYMRVLASTVAQAGGQVLWRTPVHGQPLGCEHDFIHEILAIWYPSYAAFVSLAKAEGAKDMLRRRERCVAHAVLHRCPGDSYPLQP